MEYMTRNDVEKMLYLFERCFRNCSFDEKDVDLYLWKLKGYPKALVRQTVDRLTDSSDAFSPTPGQLKQAIVECVDTSPEAETAWAEVREVGRRFTPYAKEYVEWSSPAIGRAVQAIGGLEEVGYCDHDQMGYLRHYFLQVYRQEVTGERDRLLRDPVLVAKHYAALTTGRSEVAGLPGSRSKRMAEVG